MPMPGVHMWFQLTGDMVLGAREKLKTYEEGATTPFDMAVLNDLDRFHLVGDVVDRVSRLGYKAPI